VDRHMLQNKHAFTELRYILLRNKVPKGGPAGQEP